jgi:hypothetical protein
MYWVAAVGFAPVAVGTLGWLFQVPRPPQGLELLTPWSFPSIEVLSATLAYGFLAIYLSRALTASRRWMPYAGAAIFVLVVALTRLYFGAEWLTDIIGSVALGLAWIATLGLAFHRHPRHSPNWHEVAAVAAVGVAIAFVISGWTQHHTNLATYLPVQPSCNIPPGRWQSRTEIPVSAHRRDLWRRDRRPLHLQYAGPLDVLAEALHPTGWQQPQMLNWNNALKLLSPSLPLNELPLIPHVHAGRHERLVLVKDLAADQRLVLRLWDTGCRIGNTAPLAIGDVTSLHKDTIGKLLALPVTSTNRATGNLTLRWDLRQTSVIDVSPGRPLLIAPRSAELLTLPSAAATHGELSGDREHAPP